eukprot:scaffold153998_cov28-Tisochrysis_lutea.AAC.5
MAPRGAPFALRALPSRKRTPGTSSTSRRRSNDARCEEMAWIRDGVTTRATLTAAASPQRFASLASHISKRRAPGANVYVSRDCHRPET